MNYKRQLKVFNPEEHKASHIYILGAGSTGSFIAFTLAKMGVMNLSIIDYDKVEEHNIPNQYYRKKDVGRLKVEALKEIIEDNSDCQVEIFDKKFSELNNMGYLPGSIFIICVDNMETRKEVSDFFKDNPIIIIDTRFGSQGYSIHISSMLSSEQQKIYEDSLNVPVKETICGDKAIIYTINSLASEVCNIVKRMLNKEDYPKIVRREMSAYRFIAR